MDKVIFIGHGNIPRTLVIALLKKYEVPNIEESMVEFDKQIDKRKNDGK